MITRKFLTSSVIYTLAGTLPMASAILLLPFYLHYLPAKEFGVLSLYLSFSILMQIIITYSFDSSLYLHFHDFKNDWPRLSGFVSSAFTAILVLGGAVTLIMLLAGGPIFHLVFQEKKIEFFPYGILSVVTAVFQSVFKVNNNLLQSRERPVLFLWSNLISFFLTAALTVTGLKLFPGTLMGPVGGRMLAFIISGLWALRLIYREFGVHFNVSLLRTTFTYNTFQFIYQLQQWVINYFDRFLLAVMVLMSDLGVYDFTIKCLLVIEFVSAAMLNSFFPKIIARSAQNRIEGTSIEINRYYHGLTAAIMLMVSGTILVLPILIGIFVNKPGYRSSADLVPFASLVFLLRGMKFYFSLPYSLRKDSKPLPVIFLIVSVCKIIISIGLIKRFGIYGAVFATLISSGFEIVLFWLWRRRMFNYFFNPLKLIVAPLLLMAAVLTIEPWYPFSIWQAHLFYVALAFGLLAWLYRREIVLIDFRKLFT